MMADEIKSLEELGTVAEGTETVVAEVDRKSVVEGKSVDPGGRRIMKKKKKKKKKKNRE